LRSIYPDIEVEAHHFYLKLAASIGYRQYHEISKRTWLAETVYAALLYPQRLQRIEKLFNQESGRKSDLRAAGFSSVTAEVKKISDDFINSRNWSDYLLAGFSVSLCQLTSALYFIKCIKEKFPKLIIVIGGSTFSGSTTEGFFKLFPEVDAVINGEGELPFSQLITCLIKFPSLCGMLPIKGLSIPEVAKDHNAPAGFQQLSSLNGFPRRTLMTISTCSSPSIRRMRSSLFCRLKHPVAAGGGNQVCPARLPRKCRNLPPAAPFATLTSSGKAIVPKSHHRWWMKSTT
jgi:hypothetical protein